MTDRQDTGAQVRYERAAAASGAAVPVWDWAIRATHWVIVLLFGISLTTGWIGGDAMTWHMASGRGLLALVLFRILWGFVGSRYARFTSFVRGPAAALRYLRSLRDPAHVRYAGHNPVGGWMVLLLLAALLVQATSGLFTAADLVEGPWARHASSAWVDRLSWLHRRHVWLLAGLAFVHVGAAFAYLAAFRENLIKPMVTGVKVVPPDADPALIRIGTTRSFRAVVLLAACEFFVFYVTR